MSFLPTTTTTLPLILLFCLVSLRLTAEGFLIEKMCLTDEEVESCRTCDSRSERAGKLVMARKLRDYYHDQIKITIDSGSVQVQESLPTMSIPTGHSCTVTAQARNGQATASFDKDEEALENLRWEDVDYVKYRFAKGILPATVNVKSDIRVWLGIRSLGSCRNLARKTCSVSGRSTGQNEVSIAFAASNMQIVNLNNAEHLAFNLNVSVWGQGVKGSWSPITGLTSSGCSISFLSAKILSFNSMAQKLAAGFFHSLENQLKELRSDKLIAKLEEELKARMGQEIYVRLCDAKTGRDRPSLPNVSYGRKKRSTPRKCPQTCPNGYSRVGNQMLCHKVVMDTSLAGARSQCADAEEVVFFRNLFANKNMYRCIVEL